MSTVSAKRLLGHALELRHRLSRLWSRVQSGSVPAWRARLVAETTTHATPALTKEAAGWVDGQVADLAAKVGPAQLDRLVAEAIQRHHLAEEVIDWDDGLGRDRRHATVDRGQVHYDGTVRVEGIVRIVDGIDLDNAPAHGAEVRRALGSTASLDVRRSEALGDLARLQTSLDLAGLTGDARAEATLATAPTAQAPVASTTGRNAGVTLPPARQVVRHAHFDATTTEDGGIVFGPPGRLEEGQRLILLDQVRSWCADSSTTVVVKPVIDLNAQLHTEAYAVPDRLREQIVLRDGTCVFPWCSRPARRCQMDHVVPHDASAAADGRPQPGPTAGQNLAPLCTRHHRLKTHGRWRYSVTGPGRFEWTSPHDHRYRRDPSGTSSLDPPPRVPAADPRSTTTMTPPHTQPAPCRRGHSHACWRRPASCAVLGAGRWSVVDLPSAATLRTLWTRNSRCG